MKTLTKFKRLSDDDLLFSRTFLYIKDKRMQLVPLLLNRAQRHAYQSLDRRNLYLKARQLGFSTYIQARIYRINVTRTSSSLTISDTGGNTAKIRLIYNRFHDLWPVELLEYLPGRDSDSVARVTYPENQSESSIVTAGAKTGGRGGTASVIHGSEVAFWPDAETIFSATLQSATPDAEIHLESTANGQQGMFYNLCMKALDGDPEWRLHFYPWWWAPEYRLPLGDDEQIVYTDEEQALIAKAAQGGFVLRPDQIKWRRHKLLEPGMAAMFAQEYPEDPQSAFLSGGGGVFRVREEILYAPIDHYQDVPQGLPNYGYSIGLPPDPEHQYSAGLDWGQKDDFTALSISDRNLNREVYIGYWRHMNWKDIRAEVIRALKRYNVKVLRPEENAMGSSQIEELWYEMEAAELQCVLMPFTTTAKSKHEMVQFLKSGFDDYDYKVIDDPHASSELRSFLTRQLPSGLYTYSAPEGQHDDTVICRGLSYAGMLSPGF